MVSAIRMTSRWPRVVQLLCAVLGTLGCFLIQLPIESRSFGDPFAIFLACVFMTALMFGRLSGGVAVILSSLLATLFFEPQGHFQLLRALDLLQIQIYACLALAATIFGDQIRRTIIAQSDSNNALATEDARKLLRLRELSHRVANNFSSLDALIRLRARAASDPKVAFAFEQASELVHVVARLTNRLTNADSGNAVNSRVFVRDVCEDLKACAPASIQIEYDAESHELPLGAAIPCGLMINELVTNALKYAFPNNRAGKIEVTLVRQGNALHLMVQDNGVGMSGEVHGSGLGLRLLNGFARSLNGKIDMSSAGGGTRVSVTFPLEVRATQKEPEASQFYLH
jgi:two-component system, sensor histidine kinase PdtaS